MRVVLKLQFLCLNSRIKDRKDSLLIDILIRNLSQLAQTSTGCIYIDLHISFVYEYEFLVLVSVNDAGSCWGSKRNIATHIHQKGRTFCGL